MQNIELVKNRISILEDEKLRLRTSISKNKNDLIKKRTLVSIGNFFFTSIFIIYTPTVLIWIGVIIYFAIGKNIFYRFFEQILPTIILVYGFSLGLIPAAYWRILTSINESYKLKEKKKDVINLQRMIEYDNDRVNNNKNELSRLREQKQRMSDVISDLENIL